MELSLDVESSQVVGNGVKPTGGDEEDAGLPRCLGILLSHLLHELQEEPIDTSSTGGGGIVPDWYIFMVGSISTGHPICLKYQGFSLYSFTVLVARVFL